MIKTFSIIPGRGIQNGGWQCRGCHLMVKCSELGLYFAPLYMKRMHVDCTGASCIPMSLQVRWFETA